MTSSERVCSRSRANGRVLLARGYMPRMRDGDVRRALHDQLERDHSGEPDTLFVDELSVCGMARVDVAVVNGALSAYELKSASDRLTRLPTQVEWYSKVVDHATLVVADRHIDRAAPLLPPWWGVIVATGDRDVTLEWHQQARQNPEIDPSALVRLLWRSEALATLESLGVASGLRSKPKSTLWEAVAAALPIDDLRFVVRRALKDREGWRPGPERPPDGAASRVASTSRRFPLAPL